MPADRPSEAALETNSIADEVARMVIRRAAEGAPVARIAAGIVLALDMLGEQDAGGVGLRETVMQLLAMEDRRGG